MAFCASWGDGELSFGCTGGAVEHRSAVQEPGPRNHILGPATLRWVQADQVWVWHTGSLPYELGFGGGGWLAFCKEMTLHPLKHTLFTVAQVSEQLFLLPAIFKVMFWTLCIWMPKGMLSELRPPKMLQNCMICALTATILKYLLTFSAHTWQDHHGYFSLPYHWVKAFFEILLSFRENNVGCVRGTTYMISVRG